MPTAVQFGAGNIGRGFIAQLFHESGYEVVFVDVIPETLAALNEQHAYSIHIVGKGAEIVPITNVRAVDGRDTEAVATEIARCEIACTAVGAGALKYIAPNLAAGLALRDREGGSPLNVLICENLHDASDLLRSLIAELLPADRRDAILEKTGLVQAVVSRMVPLQTPDQEEPLAVRVEAYKRLPVDANAVADALPNIVGVIPVNNFEAHVERKLYTHNCAHATLGYLGWLRGITYGYEALADPEVRSTLEAVLKETGAALVSKHGFDSAEHAAHVADLLARFENIELGDTCFRLARDPVRKLAPDDRLVGAARLCESQGVEPNALAEVIAAAFRFVTPEDHASLEIRTSITRIGFDSAMEKYTGIHIMSPLGVRVKEAYERLAGR
jgi:mannitol-1-phosphate 5-dehydrogenase